MIKKLEIHGLRGFGKLQEVEFAIPNGNEGSGITFLVGANNTGKTTIFEALKVFNATSHSRVTFSEHKRNIKNEGIVCLSIETDKGEKFQIETNSGSAATFLRPEEVKWDAIYCLPSRRFLNYEFAQSYADREQYITRQSDTNRSSGISSFSARLFKMQDNREEFQQLLQFVLGDDLNWVIEENDSGNYYLKINVNGCVHSSEGLGDGIWSVFTICDALYDAQEGSTIAIDEPELSLHPALQKRIMELVNKYSKNRQIIINTHSPYFIDISALINGANLYRTVKDQDGDIALYKLSSDSKKSLTGFTNNIDQPHVMGLEAKEIFFLEDGVILTEGQEDVIMYSMAAKELGVDINGTFFGWGAGGASNISKLANILNDLGYQKVVAIFDGDKIEDKKVFDKKFPEYEAINIPTDDIRDKHPKRESKPKEGMMTTKGKVKPEYKDEMGKLFNNVNQTLRKKTDLLNKSDDNNIT